MATDFDEITTGCPEGTGVFDELMKSVKAHLKEEYDNQRIRGSEYSQVYLGSMQSAMSQAIQWQLGAEIAANQAALILSQKEGQDKQNLLLEEQRLLIVAQTELTKEQTLTQEQQTALVTQQVINAGLDALNIPKQGELIDAQIENMGYQDQKLIQETITASEQAISAAFHNTDILPATKSKLDTEIEILAQKVITEEAQTKTVTSQGTIAGILGAQRELYVKQTDGFDRDAEQKATRIVSDIWSVLASTTDGVEGPDSVTKTNLEATLVDLKAGAGIS